MGACHPGGPLLRSPHYGCPHPRRLLWMPASRTTEWPSFPDPFVLSLSKDEWSGRPYRLSLSRGQAHRESPLASQCQHLVRKKGESCKKSRKFAILARPLLGAWCDRVNHVPNGSGPSRILGSECLGVGQIASPWAPSGSRMGVQDVPDRNLMRPDVIRCDARLHGHCNRKGVKKAGSFRVCAYHYAFLVWRERTRELLREVGHFVAEDQATPGELYFPFDRSILERAPWSGVQSRGAGPPTSRNLFQEVVWEGVEERLPPRAGRIGDPAGHWLSADWQAFRATPAREPGHDSRITRESRSYVERDRGSPNPALAARRR